MTYAPFLRRSSWTFVCLAAAAGVAAAAPAELLPDLLPWREPSRYLDNAFIVTNTGGRKMWLTGVIANRGQGPLELFTGADGKIWQRIRRESGPSLERPVGDLSFLPSSYGLIFPGAAIFLLRHALPSGGVGAVAALSPKQNWALHDDAVYKTVTPETPRDSYYVRGTSTPGISSGWADVYATSHPLQHIPLDGIADGVYWIEMVVDPNGRLVESDESNNVARARVRIEGQSVTVLPDAPPASAGAGRVYPNPWRAQDHRDAPVIFEGFGGGAVDIYTVSSRPVRSVPVSAGRANWDLKDGQGRPVAAGLYFFAGTDARGARARGRLLVVR